MAQVMGEGVEWTQLEGRIMEGSWCWARAVGTHFFELSVSSRPRPPGMDLYVTKLGV